MPFFDEEQLKKQIKTGEFAPLYFIYGEESFLKRFYAEDIIKKTVPPGFETFGLHRFDASASVGEIIEAANTMSLMGGRICVSVKDMPLNSLSKDDAEALRGFIKDPPDSAVVIFLFDEISVNPKKEAKWNTWLKHASAAGVCACIDKRSQAALCKLLMGTASKKGCELERREADYLIMQAGDSMDTLSTELEKICAYAAGRKISIDDIDRIVIKSPEAKVFDLSKAIVAGRADTAYKILDTLLAAREEPIMILGVLVSAYADMYRAKLASQSVINARDPANYFNYRNKEFRLTNASRDGAKYSVEQLRRSLSLLDTADTRLKSTGLDSRTVLEELVLGLLRI